jgi:hypothetical protein
VARALEELGLGDEELRRIRKNDPHEIMIGALVRRRTIASNGWIAKRLEMGDPTRVSRYCASAAGPGKTTLTRKVDDLEKKTKSTA